MKRIRRFVYVCSTSSLEQALPVAIPHRRWLQDTSKRKLADVLIVFVPPPFLLPRVHPRLTRRLIKSSAPDKKNRVD